MKSKFVLWQPRYYDLLTEKKDKKTFLKYSFFENALLLPISWNCLQEPYLDDILLETLTLSNSVIFVENIIRWKGDFE